MPTLQPHVARAPRGGLVRLDLAAQTTHTVGPGGFAQISDALDTSGFTAQGGSAAMGVPGAGVQANGGSTWISDAAIQPCGLPVATALHAARITMSGPACPVASGAVLGVLRQSALQTGTTFTPPRPDS